MAPHDPEICEEEEVAPGNPAPAVEDATANDAAIVAEVTDSAEAGADSESAAADDAQAPNQIEAPASADTADGEAVNSQVAPDTASSDEEQSDAPDDGAPPPVEAAAPEPANEASERAETPAETEKKEELPFRRGQLVEGVVTATSALEVTCSLADDHSGVIPSRELERMSRQVLEEMLAVGNKITVFVINPRDHRGRILLSVNRALEERDWQQAKDHQRARRPYQGFVAGYNKGGLIVRFGRLRGFVPMSQIADGRRWKLGDQSNEEKWRELVNQPITVRVIEVNRKRSRLVLSESAAARDHRNQRKAEVISRLQVGDVHEGPIVSLADFGLFVDLGGAEGLVHNSELSWRHIKNPREVFQVGQAVRVEVISIDREKLRIGLSIKRQEADPWDEVATRYAVGQLVRAKITKLTKFGAFAQLVDGPHSEGLVHISELSDGRVEHPREVVQAGESLTLRITRLDIRNRRLGLSLKRVNSAEYLDLDWQTAIAGDTGAAEPETDAPPAAAETVAETDESEPPAAAETVAEVDESERETADDADVEEGDARKAVTEEAEILSEGETAHRDD